MDDGNQKEHIEEGEFWMIGEELKDSKGAEKNFMNGSKLSSFVWY